jgi:ribosome-binding protein aMBF1 (putative translation factor)
VSLDVAKAIQKGRQDIGLSQKDLATVISTVSFYLHTSSFYGIEN